MSRTDLDPATLAASLRRMAGDDSVEWVYEPIQAAVLLDIADALDETDKLRKLVKQLHEVLDSVEGDSDICGHCDLFGECAKRGWHECEFERRIRELGIEVNYA